MAKVVILGAGLAGISAAYHLEKYGFTDYALFEKDETVGGLCDPLNKTASRLITPAICCI